jgi:hypothetical protein
VTKADPTPSRHGGDRQWLAIAVFAERTSLLSALKQLMVAGPPPNHCLAATAASIRNVTAPSSGEDYGPLHALLRDLVEMTLPGCDLAILASPGCARDGDPLLPREILDQRRAELTAGALMLGVSVRSAADLARVGRILLSHSSQQVHLLECSGPPPAQMPTRCRSPLS